MELDKITLAVKGIADKGKPEDKKADLDTILAAINDGKTENLATAETVALALIKVLEDEKEETKAVAATDDNSTVQRFFINVGEFDGFEDNDSLKKLIMDNVPTVKDTDFTDVFIRDKFSFFELPKTVIDDVMKGLIGKKVGDREVNVELSERKPRSSQGGRGGFGGGHGRGAGAQHAAHAGGAGLAVADRPRPRPAGAGGGGGAAAAGPVPADRGGYRGGDRGGYGHSDRGGYRGEDRGYSDRGRDSDDGYDRGGDRGGYGRY